MNHYKGDRQLYSFTAGKEAHSVEQLVLAVRSNLYTKPLNQHTSEHLSSKRTVLHCNMYINITYTYIYVLHTIFGLSFGDGRST